MEVLNGRPNKTLMRGFAVQLVKIGMRGMWRGNGEEGSGAGERGVGRRHVKEGLGRRV